MFVIIHRGKGRLPSAGQAATVSQSKVLSLCSGSEMVEAVFKLVQTMVITLQAYVKLHNFTYC